MKASRFLSELLIEDLAKYTGIRFAHPDRLTRDEAKAVVSWATSTPAIPRWVTDKSHENHKVVTLFHDMLKYYGNDHPQDASGAPQAWPERQNRPPAIEGQPFSDLFPDEARALHAWAQASPEYNAIYFDGSHPQHKAVVARTSALLERAHVADESSSEGTMQPPPPGATPAASPPPTNDLSPAAAMQQIKALKEDAQFLRVYQSTIRSGPEFQLHKDALARMSKLYEQAYPPAPQEAATRSDHGAPAPAPAARPAAFAAPAAASALQQIQAKRSDMKFMVAYTNKTYPDHIAAVEQMGKLYAEAYPEPAAAPPQTPGSDQR